MSATPSHPRSPRPRLAGPRNRTRLRWMAFGIGAFAAVAGLAWVTRAVVTLERDQAAARAEASRAETLRLALWRLDSWMAPRLAAEAARPYFHYLALYPPQRAYDQFLSPIAAGEVLTASPLLNFRDEVVRLHVQVDAGGRVTSPQAPEDAAWTERLEPLLAEGRRDEVSQLLDQAREDLGGIPLVRRVEEVVACQTLAIADDPQSELPFVNDLLDKLNNRAPTQWSAPPQQVRASIDVSASPALDGAGPLEVTESLAAATSVADARRDASVLQAPQSPPRSQTDGKEAARQTGADSRAAAKSESASTGRAPAEQAERRNAPLADAPEGALTKAAPPAPAAVAAEESPASRKRQAAKAADAQTQSRNPADNDYAKRLIQSSAAQVGGPVQMESAPGDPRVEIGPFVPLWVSHGEGGPALYYFRRVAVGSAELAQGFLVDWPTLVEALRQQVEDLLPHATIEPLGVPERPGLASSLVVLEQSPSNETRLASIPARLVPGPCDPTAMPSGLTPARATLGAAWLALVAAIVAAGFSLRAVAADAARRTRFAGVVTHELRTPLTTFQLYTDMLVDGMVPPERHGEYLSTLRDESHRLGHLVENVLSYARIEQGRHTARLEDVTAAELVARVEQPLRRRAEAAGFEFKVQSEVPDGERRFHVDVDSVERILFNLVDNAAKYACQPRDGTAGEGQGERGEGQSGASVEPDGLGRPLLLLELHEADGILQLAVVDHGPGVPAPQQPRLFQPFERGSDDHTQQQRGIGLGLALSRELARALGGDLRHEPTPGGGATFRLSVG